MCYHTTLREIFNTDKSVGYDEGDSHAPVGIDITSHRDYHEMDRVLSITVLYQTPNPWERVVWGLLSTEYAIHVYCITFNAQFLM